jgi:ABC-type amino acid transport substrate-binding protein
MKKRIKEILPMKKLFAVLLSAMLLLAMAACGEQPQTPDDTQEPAVLHMATEGTFPPYEYYDNGQLVGIDIEVAGAIAEKLGMKLETTDIAFDSIIPGVQAGKYDIGMAGVTVSEERLQQVNFSDSYATGVQVVIVKEGGKVQSLDDMADAIIGTQSGTTGFIYASGDFGDDHVKSFTKTTDAVEALKNGQVDCVLLDNAPAEALVDANPDAGLSILETAYTVEDYAIAINKENTDLQAKINAALAELVADGTLQSIIDKYIK